MEKLTTNRKEQTTSWIQCCKGSSKPKGCNLQEGRLNTHSRRLKVLSKRHLHRSEEHPKHSNTCLSSQPITLAKHSSTQVQSTTTNRTWCFLNNDTMKAAILAQEITDKVCRIRSLTMSSKPLCSSNKRSTTEFSNLLKSDLTLHRLSPLSSTLKFMINWCHQKFVGGTQYRLAHQNTMP